MMQEGVRWLEHYIINIHIFSFVIYKKPLVHTVATLVLLSGIEVLLVE